jgi:hypothetical protein
MIRLTLRTLLAYLDDTLPPADAKVIGQKLAENEEARDLAERIRVLVRKRSLSTPATGNEGSSSDPNVVAAYLSDALSPEMVEKFETLSLESDSLLAELAACHQILTLLLSDQVRVPPSAYKKMYGLVKGKESIPSRAPGRKAVPVGGVIPADHGAEADDADAAYLLGLPAYSRNEPVSRKVLRWGAAAVLAVGFVLAVGLAWWSLPTSAPGNAVAAAPTTPTSPTPRTEPKVETPPTKKDEPKVEDPKKDEPKAEDPKKDDPKKDEPKVEDPKKDEPKKDELGGKQPPLDNRGPVGVSDTADDQVLVANRSNGDGWERVTKGAEVQSTDRLVCLPGYKAKVQFKSGATAELVGNVPGELYRLPFAETALTPHVPYDGFDADFTLHAGRVYLGNTKDKPAVVRVRVRDPKFPVKDVHFDLTVPDKGSELVVEVLHRTTGRATEPPQTRVVIHCLKGTAGILLKGKPTPVEAGSEVTHESTRGVADGPRKAGDKAEATVYFGRDLVIGEPDKGRAMLKALRQIADGMKDAKAVPKAVEEVRRDPTGPPADPLLFVAGVVWSVYSTAALGDAAELADLLNDPNRPAVRGTACAALRGLLACTPNAIDAIRTTARDRWTLSADDTDFFLDTLCGLSDVRRKDKEALNRLADQLNAETVAQREAAQFVLLVDLDPAAVGAPGLVMDVTGPADKRTAVIALWKKRIADLTKEPK